MAGLTVPIFWNQLPPTALARMLAPLGEIYGAATAWRMRREGARLPCPVFCIGNFTAGGTGKTPMALALAAILQAQGRKPCFLSRGFGGAARRHPLRVDVARHTARDIGDEPLLLARAAPVIVCSDRHAGAKLALAQGADVLVMDDGLQNPSLAKTLSLAMVDGEAGFGNGLCLPAGPLRAPLAAQWPWVHGLVVVGEGTAGQAAADLARAAGRAVLYGRLAPDAGISASLRGQRVVAFAGIGRPSKFFHSLEAIGAEIVSRHAFADHHGFRPDEIATLQQLALSANARLVTTEKDLARTGPWPGAVQPTALPVTMEMEYPAGLAQLVSAALQTISTGGRSA